MYINPDNETKEEFLEREGLEIKTGLVQWPNVPEGMLPVVLVDNGNFTAAAIAYSENELDNFLLNVDDTRPMKLYLVETDKLLEVSQDFKKYKERVAS